MIGEGVKVRFVPHFLSSTMAAEERQNAAVIGTVINVNWEHQHLTAEYQWGESKQRETFRFWQIGKDVKVCG